MANCPESDLFSANTISSFTIDDQFGTYPENIRISGNMVSISNTISDKSGANTVLIIYDADNTGHQFNGNVISQNANIVSITTGSGSTIQYLFDATYEIGDKRWLWSKKHFTFEQSTYPTKNSIVTKTPFEQFVSALKTASDVNEIDYSTISSDLTNYRSIQFSGTITEAFEYLNRLTGKVSYYNPETNMIDLIDCDQVYTSNPPSDAFAIGYDYSFLDYNGVVVSGELNHVPASVNSVEGSELPTKFVFPIDGWEFLGINGDAGLGIIPRETIGTDKIKNPDGSITTVKHAGISFYAEAFLTYRWSPRGVVLKDFTLTATQPSKNVEGSTSQTTPAKKDVKVVKQSDLKGSGLSKSLKFKEADPQKYPEGFTEWFAVFQQSDDKQSQIINLICHRMWDLNYTDILQTDEDGSMSGTSTMDYNSQIKPLMWAAVTDAKNFASRIEIDIDYGASTQTIFPYKVTVGSEPYVEITNNDVAVTDEATDFGNNFLNTATSKTLSYTTTNIESLDHNLSTTSSAYTILRRTIRWDTSLEHPICEVVRKIG